MTSSSRRGSSRETWTTALEDFTPSASPSPSSSEAEDEEYGEIGASRRRVTGTASTDGTDGSRSNMSRGLLSARAIAHSSASSDNKDTADEPYAYGIPPSRRSSLLQQDAEPAAERSSLADRASDGPYGLDSPSPGRPSSRRQSSSSSLLDDEAARTQRKVDREAKLRQMEEAVRIASGEARSLMYGDGGLTTDGFGASSQNTASNHPAPESNAALLARGTREHLEEVKLTGGGNANHGTKKSNHVQGSVSDRLKHLLPAYWNPNENGDDNKAVAFPGSSLSTRSLTTPGRNLHDLANASSSSTSSSRIIGGGDGSSSGSQRQVKLANSGITLDFYDDYYHGSDGGISGGNKRGGASSLLSTLRDRATTVTDTVIGGRSSSHNNNGRRRLVMYVAAMAIVVGLAFHATGGSRGTAATGSPTSNSAGSSGLVSTSSSASSLSSPSSSTFGIATTSSTASSGNGHQHSTHGDNSHSISRPNPTEAASIVIDAPDAPLNTPSSPSSIGSISAAIVDEPGASSRFNAMKRRLIEEGITTVGNVHPENSLTFGGGATSMQLHTYPSMQRRALQWLADEDNRRLAVNHPYLNQRFALACLWFSTFDYSRKKDAYGSPTNAPDLVDDEDNDVRKPNWISTSNWMTPQPICSWHGVTCDKKGDVDGLVVTLALSDNGIRGYVPGELKRGLGEDVEVDMSGNHVSILKDRDGWQ